MSYLQSFPFSKAWKKKRGRVLYKRSSHPGHSLFHGKLNVCSDISKLCSHCMSIKTGTEITLHRVEAWLSNINDDDGFRFRTHSAVSLDLQSELFFHFSKQKSFNKFSVLLKILPAHSVST